MTRLYPDSYLSGMPSRVVIVFKWLCSMSQVFCDISSFWPSGMDYGAHPGSITGGEGMEQSKGKGRAYATDLKSPNALNAIFTSIISEIQTITNEGEETIRGGKHLTEVATDTLRQWQEKLSAVQDTYTNAPNSNAMSKILPNTKEIKKQLSTRS
jgi:hypothetical protein